MEDLSTMPSKADPAKTLLDETLVVVMSEFGRTPGALNNMAGRDHYNKCFPALFAGAGVKGGQDSRPDRFAKARIAWKPAGTTRNSRASRTCVATMYSALGIDWSKEIRNTPSGRAYTYVDPLGPNGYIPTDEISTIYG